MKHQSSEQIAGKSHIKIAFQAICMRFGKRIIEIRVGYLVYLVILMGWDGNLWFKYGAFESVAIVAICY